MVIVFTVSLNPSFSFIKVLSLSDGGTVATTRNKDMIGKCDMYLPQTCFGPDKMKTYSNFDDVPKKTGYGIVFLKEKEIASDIINKTDWSTIAFKSTNGAYNLRTDLIESVLISKNLIGLLLIKTLNRTFKFT